VNRPVILVVDDDPQLRHAYEVALDCLGFRVIIAVDGEEALSSLRQGPAPDMILFDLTMPKMSGWEFRAIQRGDARLAGIPVIVVSADQLEPAEADLLAACRVLRKSADVDALIRAVMDGRRCRQCLVSRLRAPEWDGTCAAKAA